MRPARELLDNPAAPANLKAPLQTPPHPPDSPVSPHRPAPPECRPDLSLQPASRRPSIQHSPDQTAPETKTGWKKQSLAETIPADPYRDEYIREKRCARPGRGPATRQALAPSAHNPFPDGLRILSFPQSPKSHQDAGQAPRHKRVPTEEFPSPRQNAQQKKWSSLREPLRTGKTAAYSRH